LVEIEQLILDRASLLYYPFDEELAFNAVLHCLCACVASRKESHVEAIIRECPQLELDFLLK
jgi:hypothetical protein